MGIDKENMENITEEKYVEDCDDIDKETLVQLIKLLRATNRLHIDRVVHLEKMNNQMIIVLLLITLINVITLVVKVLIPT